MLATLLDFGGHEWVGLVDRAQTRQHLGQLGRRNGFDGDLQNRLCHMLDRSENIQIFFDIDASQSCGLGN